MKPSKWGELARSGIGADCMAVCLDDKLLSTADLFPGGGGALFLFQAFYWRTKWSLVSRLGWHLEATRYMGEQLSVSSLYSYPGIVCHCYIMTRGWDQAVFGSLACHNMSHVTRLHLDILACHKWRVGLRCIRISLHSTKWHVGPALPGYGTFGYFSHVSPPYSGWGLGLPLDIYAYTNMKHGTRQHFGYLSVPQYDMWHQAHIRPPPHHIRAGGSKLTVCNSYWICSLGCSKFDLFSKSN
jgi:hypothetical protein